MSKEKLVEVVEPVPNLVGQLVESVEFGMGIMIGNVTCSGVNVDHFREGKKMEISAMLVGPGVLFKTKWVPGNGRKSSKTQLVPFANCKVINLVGKGDN